MAEVVVALLVFDRRGPVEEILFLFLRLLGEEVVGQANGQLIVVRQLLDNGVVVRIVLEAAAGVDDAGDAEPVELAHELAGGVDLVVEGQFRSLGQGRIEDAGIGLGQEQPGRVAVGVTGDLAARRVGRVPAIANRPEGGAIQERPVIEMQQEHRRIRGDRIDLVDRRQPLFSKLVFGKPADDPHPLRRRRDRHLALQHRHRIGERTHAVPAQLHVEVEAAAHDVGVVVVETRQHALALEVDHPGARAGQRHDRPVVVDGQELSVLDGNGACRRVAAVERGDKAVVQDQVGRHRGVSSLLGVCRGCPTQG
ncbi:hypothetical protein D9M70_491050 [compost metagenome]